VKHEKIGGKLKKFGEGETLMGGKMKNPRSKMKSLAAAYSEKGEMKS